MSPDFNMAAMTQILKRRYGGTHHVPIAKTYAAMCAWIERQRGPHRNRRVTPSWCRRIGIRFEPRSLARAWAASPPLLSFVRKGAQPSPPARVIHQCDVHNTQRRRAEYLSHSWPRTFTPEQAAYRRYHALVEKGLVEP